MDLNHLQYLKLVEQIHFSSISIVNSNSEIPMIFSSSPIPMDVAIAIDAVISKVC
jgi:hypothetical protein